MSWGAVLAITRRDLATVVRNRGVRVPLTVAPILILVVLPTFLVAGQVILEGATAAQEIDLATTPFGDVVGAAERSTAALPAQARWAVFVLEVLMAPLYLLIPLLVAAVIAADSFAGERERHTLEALLHTPTTDRELLAAKFLTAWVPALAVAGASFLLYGAVANGLAWPVLGRPFFPSLTWLLLGLWVTPGLAALGLGVMVLISSRVRSLQAAHQLGSLVVLPVLVLLVAQVTGTMLFNPVRVTIMGALIWIAAAIVVVFAALRLTRQELALRL